MCSIKGAHVCDFNFLCDWLYHKDSLGRFSSLNHQNFGFFGLPPKSPIHTGLICVKTPQPNISLGPFKLMYRGGIQIGAGPPAGRSGQSAQAGDPTKLLPFQIGSLNIWINLMSIKG